MAHITLVTFGSLETAFNIKKIQEIRIVDITYRTSYDEVDDQTISKATIATKPNNFISKVMVKHIARGSRRDGRRSVSLREFPLNTPGQLDKLISLLTQVQSGEFDHKHGFE